MSDFYENSYMQFCIILYIFISRAHASYLSCHSFYHPINPFYHRKLEFSYLFYSYFLLFIFISDVLPISHIRIHSKSGWNVVLKFILKFMRAVMLHNWSAQKESCWDFRSFKGLNKIYENISKYKFIDDSYETAFYF